MSGWWGLLISLGAFALFWFSDQKIKKERPGD